VAAGLSLAASLAITACNSSAGSSATNTSVPTSAAAAGTATSAQAQTASQFIKNYTVAPTQISVTQPLTSPPPAGKGLFYLQCEQPQCQEVGVGVKAAATAVGWNFTAIPFVSTNPASLVSGLDRALQEHATAVSIIAEPYALWSAEVPKFQAAGVPIIAAFVGPATVGSTIIANVADPSFSALNGKLLADWFISDSNAQGHVLSVNVSDYPYLGLIGNAFNSDVAASCAACKVTTLNVGIPDVSSGAINSNIVTALQKDPSLKYVVLADVAFAQGLPGAFAAAGLQGKVKVAGCCGAAAEESGLASGQFSAMTGVGGLYAGYLIVDAAVRHVEGLPIPANEGQPSIGLLTKDSNVPPADSYDVPSDYAQQFKALWKLG
jgi:ribose transport system substrate-binding protein